MPAKFKGVQNRILQLNSRAQFVPCACHKLNLMVNDTDKLVDENAFKFLSFLNHKGNFIGTECHAVI